MHREHVDLLARCRQLHSIAPVTKSPPAHGRLDGWMPPARGRQARHLGRHRHERPGTPQDSRTYQPQCIPSAPPVRCASAGLPDPAMLEPQQHDAVSLGDSTAGQRGRDPSDRSSEMLDLGEEEIDQAARRPHHPPPEHEQERWVGEGGNGASPPPSSSPDRLPARLSWEVDGGVPPVSPARGATQGDGSVSDHSMSLLPLFHGICLLCVCCICEARS
uniref:Uncharacterized protein n=1 Tax=Setaria viridis TaxID=4556 RepID=A0A4U6VQZ0_SETVI|nr:hypothetical protein SEVIR_2G095501v2 [Setaria viridis]